MGSTGVRTEFSPHYRTESTIRIGFKEHEPRKASRCEQILNIFLVLALLFSIVLIVIGGLQAAPLDKPIYNSGCPGETMIPWYLIIGGIITIALVVGRIILSMMVRRGRTEKWETCCSFCKVSCITLYDVFALVVETMWLIAGTKFVLGLEDKVNYATHRPNEDTCERLVFNFALYIVILGWVAIVILTILLICTRFCQCCQLMCCRKKEKSTYHV